MKTAFIITSTIDVDSKHPLTYSSIRSTFSNEERFRHTAFTIACLDLLSTPDTIIYLLDASENYQTYKNIFSYQKNLVYVSVKEEFPEAYRLTRIHPNKSFCETLMMIKFIERYKNSLEQFDFIFKMSGRYFTDGSFKQVPLTEENLDKLFFKLPMKFEWNDEWPFSMVDRRKLQGDNKLYQYSSIMHGWSKSYLDKILDIYRVINTFTDYETSVKYDIETLLYFFTRPYEQDILEIDWKVYGWEGVSGTYIRY
jgi:hypothetical protein